MNREMREFFARPTSFKREISRTEENYWGFFDRELTKNVVDWKQVFDYGPADGDGMQPRWPDGLPGFEAVVRAFVTANFAQLRGSTVLGRLRGAPEVAEVSP